MEHFFFSVRFGRHIFGNIPVADHLFYHATTFAMSLLSMFYVVCPTLVWSSYTICVLTGNLEEKVLSKTAIRLEGQDLFTKF